MSLKNQYRGATYEIAGASAFNTKAVVGIEEGYNLPGLVDSYSEANYDSLGALDTTDAAIGQSFTGDGRTITTASAFLRKFASPVGNVTMSIYAHSGVFGTSSVPTGTPLAVSDIVVASTLTTTTSIVPFTFSGINKIRLEYGVNYCITVDYDGDAVNYVAIGFDNSSPIHSGNKFYYFGGWTAQPTMDTCFYIYGDVEYTKIGDFKIEDITASGEQQQRLTLNLSHISDYSNNHYQPITSEHKSAINYRTRFPSSDVLASDWESSDGATVSTMGLNILQPGVNTRRAVILGKYPDLSDVRILMKIRVSTNSDRTREISTIFRRTDEQNFMRIAYGRGIVRLIDTTDGVETVIATRTGVSVRATFDYYMHTVVHNDRVLHLGSTNGINYTTYFNEAEIYGGSWATANVMNNTVGTVGIQTYGGSNGTFTISDFQVCSLDDQYTYDQSARTLGIASGIFGVSIENEFDDMRTMLATPGASWDLTKNQATRVVSHLGSSQDTLMTTGDTYTDFVAECVVSGISGQLFGMCFGNSDNFWGYYTGYNIPNESLDRMNTTRASTAGLGIFISTPGGMDHGYKLVKQGDMLGWYIDGIRVATAYGSSSGDILNFPGRVGFFSWGQTAFGTSLAVRNFRISKLDTTVDSFEIQGNESPRASLDRFIPRGFAINSTSEGINIVKMGSSRGVFTINSAVRSPNLVEKYNSDPSLVSARGEKHSNNLNAGISRTTIRVDDSYIVNYSDDNIRSTANAKQIAQDIMDEENLGIFEGSIEVNAIPTLETYDKVTIVDSTLGSSRTYVVSSMDKQFTGEGRFTQNMNLKSDGK